MTWNEQAYGHAIINSSSITKDTYSGPIRAQKNGFSLVYSFNSSGNLVAVLKLQCRNHHSQTWTDVNNITFPSDPDGSTGNDEISFSDAKAVEYRVMIDFTSGDGEFVMYINHKD